MKLNLVTVILIFILTFILANTSFAGQAKLLKQGEVAPFAGMLLEPKLELKARTAIIQNEQYQDLVENQYEMINTLHQSNVNKEKQIAILQNKADSTMIKVLYFIGGVIVGGAAVQAINGR